MSAVAGDAQDAAQPVRTQPEGKHDDYDKVPNVRGRRYDKSSEEAAIDQSQTDMAARGRDDGYEALPTKEELPPTAPCIPQGRPEGQIPAFSPKDEVVDVVPQGVTTAGTPRTLKCTADPIAERDDDNDSLTSSAELQVKAARAKAKRAAAEAATAHPTTLPHQELSRCRVHPRATVMVGRPPRRARRAVSAP